MKNVLFTAQENILSLFIWSPVTVFGEIKQMMFVFKKWEMKRWARVDMTHKSARKAKGIRMQHLAKGGKK